MLKCLAWALHARCFRAVYAGLPSKRVPKAKPQATRLDQSTHPLFLACNLSRRHLMIAWPATLQRTAVKQQLAKAAGQMDLLGEQQAERQKQVLSKEGQQQAWAAQQQERVVGSRLRTIDSCKAAVGAQVGRSVYQVRRGEKQALRAMSVLNCSGTRGGSEEVGHGEILK